jgi:pilus assembly protein TadC
VNEIKKEQMNVSEQVAKNLNMSMQAIDKYTQLVEKYEQAEENITRSYTALEEILRQGRLHIDSIFQTILGKLNFVINIQEWLVSQLFDIRAFMIYFAFSVLIFIATSFERTLAARFPLLLGTVCNYFIEFLLVRFLSNGTPHEIQAYIEIERICFLLVAGVVFLFAMITYQNYQKRNNEILKELKLKLQYIERTPYWIHKYFSRRKQLIANYKNTTNNIHDNEVLTDPGSQ